MMLNGVPICCAIYYYVQGTRLNRYTEEKTTSNGVANILHNLKYILKAFKYDTLF